MENERYVSESHYSEFSQTYMQAMLAWQLVETNLFFLFSHLVASRRETPIASAIYYSIASLSGRLEVTETVFRIAQMPEEFVLEWAVLAKAIRTGAKNRNKLAHSTIKHYTDKDGQNSFRVASIEFDMTYQTREEHTLGQVAGWLKQFHETAMKFADFNARLGAQFPSHSHSQE